MLVLNDQLHPRKQNIGRSKMQDISSFFDFVYANDLNDWFLSCVSLISYVFIDFEKLINKHTHTHFFS